EAGSEQRTAGRGFDRPCPPLAARCPLVLPALDLRDVEDAARRAPLPSLVHDLIGLEGVALLPRAVHADVIAGARSPDVHRAFLVHVADVDLHRKAGAVVAHLQVAVMLMEPNDGAARPPAPT